MPETSAAPDWSKFRAAYRAGLPNAERLGKLQRLEAMLDLAPEPAKAALAVEAGRAGARDLYQNLLILNFALQRDAGIVPGPEASTKIQELIGEVQRGTADRERTSLVRRLCTVWEAAAQILQIDPTVAQGPSPEELEKTKVMQESIAIFSRLACMEGRTVPGAVSADAVEQLRSVLTEALALIGRTDPNNGALPYVFHMAGATARMLGDCEALLGQNREALEIYAEAAEYFKKAGEPSQEEDCRERERILGQKLSGDLDAAAAAALEWLSAAKPDSDPFDTVKALMRLADVASSAGDTFEAQRTAREAAAALTELGYPSPLTGDVSEAVNCWIDKASERLSGVPLLGRLSQIATWYDGIAGAEFAVAVIANKPESERIYAIQCEVHRVIAQLSQEARAASAEHNAAMSRYFPAPAGENNVSGRESGREFSEFLNERTAIDDALSAIRRSCNERAGTQAGMRDLLSELHQLQARADRMNSPEYEAKTRLEEAYVLGHLGRSAEMIPVAQEARRRLLSGRPDRIGSLAQSHERYLYLDSRMRELQGRMMTGDMEGGLDIAESTIRDFETERYLVQNEFRQAALLSCVADFYKFAAFGAFKTKKWDSMLAAIDLIKARSAVRSCLTPRQGAREPSEAAREFQRVSDELVLADEPLKKRLEERRRRLWDLLSVSRMQRPSAANFPELTVKTLQASLSGEEVLVSYLWLNASVLLTVVVTQTEFHAERIVLGEPDSTRLQAFAGCVQTLTGPQLGMDKAAAKLGEILLPAFVRELMRGKRRVIFSPNASLHLFPFHAARWEQGFVGTAFAVSYVPNFSSLLLPRSRQPENRILAIAISRFADPSVPSLRNVESDIQVIRSYYEEAGGAVEVYLGAEATRARIGRLRETGDLERFRCIHLGTHGRSVFETPNEPLESSLQLQDGPLDAMDIANLQLNADLVVLSACNSGQRAIRVRNLGEAPGDDLFGLQAALFKAGARSILGSLWIVHVDSASAIARNFHRHYAAGAPADMALQESVRAYMADRSVSHQVFYWAPFFLNSIGSRKQEGGEGGNRTNRAAF